MLSNIRMKRIYETPRLEDGRRVLVDRIWPRGISKDAAKLDVWLKEVAPSPELRKWFRHQPERFQAFKTAYEEELRKDPKRQEALQQIINGSKEGAVTLLYGAKDTEHNHVVVLKGVLKND